MIIYMAQKHVVNMKIQVVEIEVLETNKQYKVVKDNGCYRSVINKSKLDKVNSTTFALSEKFALELLEKFYDEQIDNMREHLMTLEYIKELIDDKIKENINEH